VFKVLLVEIVRAELPQICLGTRIEENVLEHCVCLHDFWI